MKQSFRLVLILLLGIFAIPALAEGDKGKWECKAGPGGWDCNWSGQGPAPEPEKVEKKSYPEYAPQPEQTEVTTQALPEHESEDAAIASQPQEARQETVPAYEPEPAPAPAAKSRAPVSAWESPVPQPAPIKKAASTPKAVTPEPVMDVEPATQQAFEDEIDEAPAQAAAQTTTTAPAKASAMDKVKSWFGGSSKAAATPAPEVRSQAVTSETGSFDQPASSMGSRDLAPVREVSSQPPPPRAATVPVQQEATASQPAASGGVMGTVKSWFGMGGKSQEAEKQPAGNAAQSRGMGLDKKVQAVQIHASANRKELEAIHSSHSFDRQVWIMTETRNSAPWYCLLTGPYADLHQALNAIEVMPNSLQQYSPWVRRVPAP